MPMDGILSVREYITTPVDGTTSNQTGIVNAINAAKSAGARLFWPVGTYVSDANIPDFHTVRHVGPGIVKRGTGTFHVEPIEGQTNIIYVRPSGASVTSDGLNAVNAISINRASEILLNYGPLLSGTWNFKLAEGTYKNSSTNRLQIGPNSDNKEKDTILCANYVIFEGPDVEYDPISKSRPIPIAVFEGDGNTAVVFNFNGGFRAIVRNIKFQNYRGGSSGGIAVSRGALRCENVHTAGCRFGIMSYQSFLEVKGGWIYGGPDHASTAYTGILSLFLNKHDIGNQGAGQVGQGPLISFCNKGVLAQEGSTGHSDFVSYEDNTIAIEATVNSRVNTNGSEFKRNAVAISSQSGAVFYAPKNVLWNTGTSDQNQENMRLQNGQLLFESADSQPQSYEIVDISTTSKSVTGTISETELSTHAIEAHRLTSRPGSLYKGKALRVKASGSITGTNGSKSFFIRIGQTQTLLSGGIVERTGNGAFVLEASIYLTSSTSQKSCMHIITAFGSLPARATSSSSSVNTASASPSNLTLSCKLEDASDAVTIETFEVELTG